MRLAVDYTVDDPQVLCIVCECDPPARGSSSCFYCLEQTRSRVAQIYAERKRRGLCVKCGAPTEQFTTCARCRARRKPQKMELITTSRLKSFRRCARHHFYSYEIGRRPIRTGEALGFGTLFHHGLEAWWEHHVGEAGNMAIDVAIGRMRSSFEAVAMEGDLSEFDLIKAEELMCGYHCRWSTAMEDLEVIGVESQFQTPMTNPLTGRQSQTFQLGGKVDAIVRVKSTSQIRNVEHKTTTTDISPGSAYWTALRMDGQVSQYMDGAASIVGEAIDGTIYDVAKRPTHKPKLATPEADRKYTQKASKLKDGTVRPAGSLHAGMREADETPEEFRGRIRENIAAAPDMYYQRGDVVRLDDEMVEFRFDTWESSKSLRERQLAGRELGQRAWPRNPDACHKWGRPCEYHLVCTGASDISDEHLFRTSSGQHEELSANDVKAE